MRQAGHKPGRKGGIMQNCHGCKWLDRYQQNGRGYCCMVTRSKTQGEKCRKPDMPACELYEAGDFATRYEKKT